MRKYFLLLLCMVLGQMAFAQSPKSKFIGKWVLDDNSIMTYKKDGSCVSVNHSKQASKGIDFTLSISTPGTWRHEGDSLFVDADEKKITVSISLADPNSVDITKRQSIESQLKKLAEPIREKLRNTEIPMASYFVKDINDDFFDIVKSGSDNVCHGMKK